MATEELLPRDLEGGYRLLGRLGEGGMGVVYRGTALALERPVAVKMLRPDVSDARHQLADRFLNEARVCAQIESAHIVDVLHFGETQAGELFLVMEYLRGRTLEQVLHTEGRLTPERVVHIGVQLCRALGAAHDLGVVHRDLKPANVMLVRRDGVDDFVKVLDFGIAKLVREQRAGLTGDGMIVGTFHSIAPEQVTGKPLDGRADMYAFGALLYRALTGSHVFDADDAATFAYHHVHTAPVPPTQRFADLHVPPALELVVMRCLEKDPARRYRDMREAADALLDVFGTTGHGMPTQAIARHLGLRAPSDEAPGHTPVPTAAPVAHAAEPVRQRTDVFGTPRSDVAGALGAVTDETQVDPSFYDDDAGGGAPTQETPMPTAIVPTPPSAGSGSLRWVAAGVFLALLITLGGTAYIIATYDHPTTAADALEEQPTRVTASRGTATATVDDEPAPPTQTTTPPPTTTATAEAAPKTAPPAQPSLAAKPAQATKPVTATKPTTATKPAAKKSPAVAAKPAAVARAQDTKAHKPAPAKPASARPTKKTRAGKSEWTSVGAPPPLP